MCLSACGIRMHSVRLDLDMQLKFLMILSFSNAAGPATLFEVMGKRRFSLRINTSWVARTAKGFTCTDCTYLGGCL